MFYINTRELSKKIRNQTLLRPLSINLSSEVIWLIRGPNGCGKSTFFKAVLGHIKTKGKIDSNVSTFAYAPERNVFPDLVTPLNFLMALCKVYQLTNADRLNRLCALFNISEETKMIGQLSKGNKQKIVLIQALMVEADCYLFDEPLSGLDKVSQANFLKEIKSLHQNGKLVVIATHFSEKYSKLKPQILDMEETIQ